MSTQASSTPLNTFIGGFGNVKDLVNDFQNKKTQLLQVGEVPWFGKIPLAKDLLVPGARPHFPVRGIVEDEKIGYKPQSYLTHLAAGTTTFGGTLAREIIIKDVYRASAENSVGMQIIFPKNFDNFETGWRIPTTLSWQYGLPLESGIVDIQKLNYWQHKMQMKRGGMAVMITDASRVTQNIAQISADIAKRTEEAMSESIDTNIINTLLSGAGGGTAGTLHTVGAAKWDLSTTNPDIMGDMAIAQKALIDNVTLSDAVVQKETIHATLPRGLKPFLASRPGIIDSGSTGGVATISASENVLNKVLAMGYQLHFSTNSLLANQALVNYSNEDTAVFGTFVGDEIPMIEQERLSGSGTVVRINRIYNTKVAPYDDGQTTSKNIGKIAALVT